MKIEMPGILNFLLSFVMVIGIGCEPEPSIVKVRDQGAGNTVCKPVYQTADIYGASVVRSQFESERNIQGSISDEVYVNTRTFVNLNSSDTLSVLLLKADSVSVINELPRGIVVDELILDLRASPNRTCELLNSCWAISPRRLVVRHGIVSCPLPMSFSSVVDACFNNCSEVSMLFVGSGLPSLQNCQLLNSRLTFTNKAQSSWNIRRALLRGTYGYPKSSVYEYYSKRSTFEELYLEISTMSELKGIHKVRTRMLFLNVNENLGGLTHLPRMPDSESIFLTGDRTATVPLERAINRRYGHGLARSSFEPFCGGVINVP